MAEVRVFADASGVQWRAEVVTRGRTSDYLNPRVHKPIVQFTCLSARAPKRYSSLADADPASLLHLTNADLTDLFGRARTH